MGAPARRKELRLETMFNLKTCLALATFAAMASVSTAHLTMLCSATSAKRPGDIDFYFGTYHSYTASAPGKIKLTNTGGTKRDAAFNQNFKTAFTISSVPNVKTHLINAVKNPAIIGDSYAVSCYTTIGVPANKPPPKDGGAWIIPAPASATDFSKWGCTDAGSSFKKVNMFSRVSINKATSGDWKFEVSGTNAIYDPQGKQLCALSTANPRWIGGMSVADGTPPCKDAPTVPSSINADSVKQCAGTIGGAVCTGFKCSKDLKDPKAQGELKCEKGKWVVTAKCVGEPIRQKEQCELVAETSTTTVETSVNNMQLIINNLADGSKCASTHQDIVNKATKDHNDAVAAHKKAETERKNSENTQVQIGSHTFSSLDGTTCNQFFTTSSYTTAKAKHTAAVKAEVKAKSDMDSFKKVLDEAIEAQKKAVRKCQCTVRDAYNAAWVTATTHNSNNKVAWYKAQHLICVHKGDLVMGASGTTTGKRNFPACPQVKPKQLHISVSVLKDTDCKKGVHFVADVEQIEAPSGMHVMPDGSFMRDEDMY